METKVEHNVITTLPCIYIYKLSKNNTREVYYSEFHVENNLQVYI